jgi:hypothetical protein
VRALEDEIVARTSAAGAAGYRVDRPRPSAQRA